MTIPISVTVTGGNIKKSAAVAESIQEALAEKGFTDVKYVNRPFTKPQVVGEQGQTKSLLDQIQASYPQFMEDPIEVRAIPVMGLDLAGEKELEPYWRADVDQNDIAQSFAQIDIDKDGRGEMQVFFSGEGFPPRQNVFDDDAATNLLKRACEIAIRKNETLGDAHYTQAANELAIERVTGKPASNLFTDAAKEVSAGARKSHLRVVETEEP
jgi:hypothetical protein